MNYSAPRENSIAPGTAVSRFRFEGPHAYLLIASAALAVAVERKTGDIWTGLAAFATVWISAGLAIQGAEIWQSHTQAGDLSAGQRWAWRFEAGWRSIVALLLPVYFLVQNPDDSLVYAGTSAPAALSGLITFLLFGMLLITALASNALASTAKRGAQLAAPVRQNLNGIPWHCGTALTAVFAVALALLIVLQFAPFGDVSRQTEFKLCAGTTACGALLVMAVAYEFGQIARATQRQIGMRAGLAGLGFAAAGYSLYWLKNAAAVQSPDLLSDAAETWSAETVGSLACLLLLTTTVLAWRSVARVASVRVANVDAPENALAWRAHPRHYYHESRWVAGLVLLAAAGMLWSVALSTIDLDRVSSHASDSGMTRVAMEWFSGLAQPGTILLIAICLVALRGVMGRRINEEAAAAMPPKELAVGKFVLVWLVLLVALVLAAAAIGWFGFSAWHSSWNAPLPPA